MYVNIKAKHIIIWSFVLLILIFTIIFLGLKTNKIIYGKKIILNEDTLNLSSYYAEYGLTVISNKNINTYSVKEWYKEGIGNKTEYLDYMKNNVYIISTPLTVYISNDGNKADILIPNIYSNQNILSLATYISIFNKDVFCSCIKNVYEKEGEINIMYSICNNENCMQSSNLKHLGITGFNLIIKENKPITYTVYTGNKKEYACIVYNKFEANIEILDDVFNIIK